MGYADVNGLRLRYEEHGSGQPLVLIHGGLGCGEMWAPVLPQLAKDRQVITVDLQGHGGTADADRPLEWPALGDDVAGLIRYLGLGPADVMGYSLGGGAALRTAIQHPDLVRRLVVVSTPCRRDGWFDEVLAGQAQLGAHLAEPMKQSPPYQAYARVAPNVADWPVLLDKTGDLTRQDYDWSAEIPAITAPVLLACADADAIRLTHIAEFYALLGGGLHDPGWDGSGGRPASRLAVLPGHTHYDVFASPELAAAVIAFLDAPA